MILTVDKKTFH